MAVQCPRHPWYKGVYKHRTNCLVCDTIYFENHGQLENPIPQLAEKSERRRERLLKRMQRALARAVGLE